VPDWQEKSALSDCLIRFSVPTFVRSGFMPDTEIDLLPLHISAMKTPLFTPDSLSGISEPRAESRMLWRRSPFLYSAALRFGREPLRLISRGPDSIATRVNFRRASAGL